MRIASSQIYQQGVNSMQDVSRQLAKTQQQIASGRRFATPADDPVAASRVVHLNQELALRDQYQRNITLVSNQLDLEDAVLGQATDVLQRIRELTIAAGNGALTQQDRGYLAAEIHTRSDELLTLMNSKNASGEYLFAGSRGQTEPFVRDAAGAVVFRGDEGQRRVQVSASNALAINDSGRRLFMDVPSVATAFTMRAHPDNDVEAHGSIGAGVVVDQAKVDALSGDNLLVTFNPPAVDGQVNFTVRRMSDGRVVDGLDAVPYVAGAAVTAQGMQFKLYGNPEAGDRFILETANKRGVMDTIEQFAQGLNTLGESGADQAALLQLNAATLGNLDNAMDAITTVRAEVGARMNTADAAATLHQDVEILSKDLLSKLRDVDFAEAISRLDMQSFVLQAAQQSYARITGLSLFNML
jgi:flagellar hook-associated protein 3 FlgL